MFGYHFSRTSVNVSISLALQSFSSHAITIGCSFAVLFNNQGSFCSVVKNFKYGMEVLKVFSVKGLNRGNRLLRRIIISSVKVFSCRKPVKNFAYHCFGCFVFVR